MKGSSDIVQSIINLRKAKYNLQSFCNEYAGSKGESLFSGYLKKIEWIYKDLITNPFLPKEVIDGIKKEWAGDVFVVDVVIEKYMLLTPEEKEEMEVWIDEKLNKRS